MKALELSYHNAGIYRVYIYIYTAINRAPPPIQ